MVPKAKVKRYGMHAYQAEFFLEFLIGFYLVGFALVIALPVLAYAAVWTPLAIVGTIIERIRR